MASTRVATPVTQENHGFVRGTCVVFNGTDWVVASAGSHGVGVVGNIMGGDTFEFVQMGAIDGLEGLTPGATYYPGPDGSLSTAPSGTAIGTAYTDLVLFVGSAPGSGSSTTVDTSNFVTNAQLVAAVAAANDAAAAAIAAAAVVEDGRHLHSIEYDAVISVAPGNVGVVFSESDGTQVLVG